MPTAVSMLYLSKRVCDGRLILVTCLVAIRLIFAIIMLYMTGVEGGRRSDVKVPLHFDDVRSWGKAVAQVFPWAQERAISAKPSKYPELFSHLPSELSNILSNAVSREEEGGLEEKDVYLTSLTSASRAVLDNGIANLNTWCALINMIGWNNDVSKSALEKMIDKVISQDVIPDIAEFGSENGRGDISKVPVIYTNQVGATEFQREIATPLRLNGFRILSQVVHPRVSHGHSTGVYVQAVFTHKAAA